MSFRNAFAGVIVAGAVAAPLLGAVPASASPAVVSHAAVVPSGVVTGKPQCPNLSKEEQEAVDNKNAGRPYDQGAYNRAQQKIKQSEK
jgi:hypothetical protein